jgi:hypothetical protein
MSPELPINMIIELFNLTFIAECCAFLAALYLLDKMTGIWRLFILFLFITILAEAIGWWMVYVIKYRNNTWIFNLLLLFNGSFSLLVFASTEKVLKIRNMLYLGIYAFILFGVFNIIFLEGFMKYNSYTELLQDLLVSVYVCWFFYRVLSEETYRNLFGYEYFWIAVGFLFSSLGSIVLYLFLNALDDYYKHTHINIYGYINYGLNIVFYLSLIISFLCRRRNTRSLQVS